jgi:hypothetical protein
MRCAESTNCVLCKLAKGAIAGLGARFCAAKTTEDVSSILCKSLKLTRKSLKLRSQFAGTRAKAELRVATEDVEAVEEIVELSLMGVGDESLDDIVSARDTVRALAAAVVERHGTFHVQGGESEGDQEED